MNILGNQFYKQVATVPVDLDRMVTDRVGVSSVEGTSLEETLSRLFVDSPKNQQIVTSLLRDMNDSQRTECVQILKGFSELFSSSPVSKEFQGLIIKLLVVVGKNLPILRSNSAIPDDVKYLFGTNRSVSFMCKVMLASQKPPFLKFKEHLEKYNQLILQIKQSLFEQGSEKAISWKPRNIFLYLWARQLILSTAHPVIQQLKHRCDESSSAEDRGKVNQFLESFYSTLTKSVFAITIVDDVVDCIQDRTLASIFTSGPFNNSKQNANARVLLEREYPVFLGLFDLNLLVWREFRLELKVLIGNDEIFYRKWPEFQKSLREVMASLEFSIEINEHPDAYVEGNQMAQIEQNLSANMMMSFYKHIEDAVLEAMGIESCVSDDSRRERSFEAYKLGEVIGHSGNNLATLMRELCEGDISNTLIFVADFRLRSHLMSINSDFNRFVRKMSSFTALNLTDDLQLDSFVKWAQYIRDLDKQLVSGVIAIFSELGIDYSDDICRVITPENFMAVLNKTFTDDQRSRYQSKIEELERINDQKFKVLCFLTDLLEDSRLNIVSSYYERILVDFERLRELKDCIPGMKKYIGGVEELLLTYLAFKSDL